MKFDYRKLKSRIIERFGSMKDFANALGVSENLLSQIMSNKKHWESDLICKAVELLEIPDIEVQEYFFKRVSLKKLIDELTVDEQLCIMIVLDLLKGDTAGADFIKGTFPYLKDQYNASIEIAQEGFEKDYSRLIWA